MTLQEYVLKYGTPRLIALSILCDTEYSYMNNLLYTINSGHTPPKRPSLKLAKKMIDVTFGELTLDDLLNPIAMTRIKERPRMKKGTKNSMGLEPQKAKKSKVSD